MRQKHMRAPDDVPLRKVATLAKGQNRRKIIAKAVHEGREYALHATKGYRSTRA